MPAPLFLCRHQVQPMHGYIQAWLDHPTSVTEAGQRTCFDAHVCPAFSLTFNRANEVNVMMNATSLTSRFAADQLLIHIYRPLSTDRVLVGRNHAGSQFVQQLKGCFLAANAELPLKLKCRPESHLQRRSRRTHDGTCDQRNLIAALSTPMHSWPRHNPLRIVLDAACRTRKTGRPADCLKIGSARTLIRKHPLKFKQRHWLENLLRHQTLPVAVWCGNRIGMI